MNIYIPIEVKHRELEGRVLLALAAAERGHSVVLGGKEDTIGLACEGALKPGIVHEKSLTPRTAKLRRLRALRSRGHVITSQDEESGLLGESYEAFAHKRYSVKTCALADRILAWGRHDANAIRHLFCETGADKVVETGSPRVDFWRAEFSGYFAPSASAASAGRGDGYILVVSNLAKVLNANRLWDLVQSVRDSGRDYSEEEEFTGYAIASWQIRMVAAFVRMVRTVARVFPEVPVVLRPHPVEHEAAWPALVGDHPNVAIIREGGLTDWVRNATVVIHNSCTSGIEAAVCGTPRIAYRPIRSEYEFAVPNRVSYEAGTLNELLNAVGESLAGGELEVAPEAQTLLRERFANLEGALAADRVVDAWEELSTASLDRPNNWSALRAHQRIRGIRRGLKRAAVRLGLTNGAQRSFRTRHKFPGLRDAEIEAVVGGLRSTLGRFENVRYGRFGRRSFLFRAH